MGGTLTQLQWGFRLFSANHVLGFSYPLSMMVVCHAGEGNDDDGKLDEWRKKSGGKVFEESSRMEKERERARRVLHVLFNCKT